MTRHSINLALALFVSAGAAFAQGRITNAKTETRTVSQSLEREVQAVAARGGATWVGYRAPMVAGPRQMCCYDSISCPWSRRRSSSSLRASSRAR